MKKYIFIASVLLVSCTSGSEEKEATSLLDSTSVVDSIKPDTSKLVLDSIKVDTITKK